MEHATAHRLAQEIRQSEEYQTYHALKEEVMADEKTAALLKEYKKLQLRLQMAAVSGTQPETFLFDYAFSRARVLVGWSQTSAGPKYWMAPG